MMAGADGENRVTCRVGIEFNIVDGDYTAFSREGAIVDECLLARTRAELGFGLALELSVAAAAVRHKARTHT
jgi:hypothetical protein